MRRRAWKRPSSRTESHGASPVITVSFGFNPRRRLDAITWSRARKRVRDHGCSRMLAGLAARSGEIGLVVAAGVIGLAWLVLMVGTYQPAD